MKTIIFDVDGVLADSLTAHKLFLIDQAKKYNISLKKIQGEVPNSMVGLLIKQGFPKEVATEVFDTYNKKFHEYEVNLFDGIPALLDSLKGKAKLGLCSSNVLTNVKSVLGEYMSNFELISILEGKGSKSDFLKTLPTDILFIGDTKSDLNAAKLAGVNFLGSGYGWELTSKDCSCVDSVEELKEHLLKYVEE